MESNPDKYCKTREQRVLEAVEILKNLKSVGIPDSEPGFVETKQKLDEFVKSGFPWEGKILFPRFGRYAEVILAAREGRKNTFVLKATNELKKMYKDK